MNDKTSLGLEVFRAFRQEHGTAGFPCGYVTPDGFKLGYWASEIRRKHRLGQLPARLKEELTTLGFLWKYRTSGYSDRRFQRGFEETLRYRRKHGTCNSPQCHVTSSGYRLGQWQANIRACFRAGKLRPGRFKRLKEIGFSFELGGPYSCTTNFDVAIQKTLRYRKAHGKTRAPSKYKTPEGYCLGLWQATQREKFRDGRLKPNCVAKLEAIDFDFSILSSANLFEHGFSKTLSLYREKGECNVQRLYRTPDSFKLGVWQAAVRNRYQQGTLSKDRIRRLESIGFIWNLLEHFFSRGYQATLRYKAINGRASCPALYVTPEGFHLGSWQSRIRFLYHRGMLPKERVRLLNQIGLDWGRSRIAMGDVALKKSYR